MSVQNLSSNWKILQARLEAEKKFAPPLDGVKRKHGGTTTTSATRTTTLGHKRARLDKPHGHQAVQNKTKSALSTGTRKMEPQTKLEQSLSVASAINSGLSQSVEIGKYIALDCEMVGVGSEGVESALARVSIVNYNGEQVYDSYVLPKEKVVDWRTPVSGIRPEHMNHARTLEEVQDTVAGVLKDRIVVGHALRHDFKALMLDHPIKHVRDTSKLKAYQKLSGGTPKLSLLASELLGLEIQTGEHSSLDDARACMLLFKRDRAFFEAEKRMPGGKRVRGKKR